VVLMRSRRVTCRRTAWGLLAIGLGLSAVACGGDYWDKVTVTEINATEICFIAPAANDRQRCEPTASYNVDGEIKVGDCLEVVLAHPTLEILKSRRADGCRVPPVPGVKGSKIGGTSVGSIP